MRRNIANKIAIVCLVAVVASGCKARKMVSAPVATNAPVVVDNSKANTIAAIKSRQLTFNTFSGKADADLNIDNDNKSVSMNIRIAKGKQIWVSVSINILASIEVGRALITPDSIKLMNKVEGVYIKKPFSYIHAYTGKQVNYTTVESLLTGNAVPELLSMDADLQKTDNNITLSGKLQQLLYKMIFNPDMKVSQLNLSDNAQQQAMQVTNSKFVLVDGRTLPSQINIASTLKEKKISINLEYSKIDLDRVLDYPFNIPESYKPAN
ncbi:DUF4292 domain-containing protein [Mucilaginibacter calamicampi]|uniref:DUF4292 domain-containing protein n=1 Tax=Mucilaginibacter calamicampi TaxID=1302352 RepID=A0ABW2YYS5_9SPHI